MSMVLKLLFSKTIRTTLFLNTQAEMVSDAAWGCDWTGTPVSFQRCLVFIIGTAKMGFTLTAGKFVPVSNKTMLNVRLSLNYEEGSTL
jgi:hypothetical protein